LTEELIKIRNDIDGIDDKILTLLEKRVTLAKRIALVKIKRGIPIRDEQREKELLERVVSQAESLGLDPELTGRIFREIIELAVDVQRRP
jgi:chorismate mutase/prephenate dehydratase